MHPSQNAEAARSGPWATTQLARRSVRSAAHDALTDNRKHTGETINHPSESAPGCLFHKITRSEIQDPEINLHSASGPAFGRTDATAMLALPRRDSRRVHPSAPIRERQRNTKKEGGDGDGKGRDRRDGRVERNLVRDRWRGVAHGGGRYGTARQQQQQQQQSRHMGRAN